MWNIKSHYSDHTHINSTLKQINLNHCKCCIHLLLQLCASYLSQLLHSYDLQDHSCDIVCSNGNGEQLCNVYFSVTETYDYCILTSQCKSIQYLCYYEEMSVLITYFYSRHFSVITSQHGEQPRNLHRKDRYLPIDRQKKSREKESLRQSPR